MRCAIFIYGIDFTSAPSKRKPITCAVCREHAGRLRLDEVRLWDRFEPFEAWLASDGPWIAALDFPFSLPRICLEQGGFAHGSWSDFASDIASIDKPAYIARLEAFKRDRVAGDRHHKRACDRWSGAQSPQTLFGVPVGKMLFEGVPRLWRSAVSIPILRPTSDNRVVVEGYPGLRARSLIGRRSYKADDRQRQDGSRRQARLDLLAALAVDAPSTVIDDPSGDVLDALLCATQAHWAWQNSERHYGLPLDADPLEGWIAGCSELPPC